MARKPVMAGNWKMNKNCSEAVKLSQEISYKVERAWGEAVDMVLCPPAIDIKSVANVLAFDKSPIAVAAQNVFYEESGAYTGEISVDMIKEAGCSYCIIGHSERRQLFGESDATVNLKAKALIAKNIIPIICCGESIDTRDAGLTDSFVCAQVCAALKDLDADTVKKIIIAYEPIWAIGTGRVPTPEAADQVCAAIRGSIAQLFDAATADAVRILYGGSMKPENAKQFLPMPNIDGGLIGGAALKAESFVELIKACL